MKNSTILALIDALLSERLSDLDSLKGPRGFKGKPGKDFDLNEHLDTVSETLSTVFNNEKESFKLKFNDLSLEEKEELTLKFENLSLDELAQLKGSRGQRGKAGSFIFEDHKKDIEISLNDYIDSLDLKLNFSDLSQEEKESLSLHFSQLTIEEKESLKGEVGSKGLKGSPGKEGLSSYEIWLSDNIGSEKDFLNSLIGESGGTGKDGEKGLVGPRGQRGKRGESGASTYDLWSLENEGTEEIFLGTLKGLDGARGPIGLNGEKGKDGSNGLFGKDGEDAPRIVDIEIEQLRNNRISFIFTFSDGSVIETGSISMPTIQQLAYSMVHSSGGGGGGISSVNVSDGVATVATGDIEFTNATVVDNAGVAEVTIDPSSFSDGITTVLTDEVEFKGATVTNDAGKACVTIDSISSLSVADEGNVISNNVKSIDFIGADVTAINCTVMADWTTLAEVDFIGSWESVNPGLIKVHIDANNVLANVPCDASVFITAAVRMTGGGTAINALADSLANSNVIGVVEGKPTATTCDIRVSGTSLSVFAGLDVTKQYFLSATTPGQMATTIPVNSGEIILKIGQPFSSDTFLVDKGQATVRV